jgi:UPF0176 protein
MTWIVATFYKFVALPDYQALQPLWLEFCQAREIRGTILLAAEGINATITGSRSHLDEVLNFIKSDHRFADLSHRESLAEQPPFKRLKIRLKKEIVTFGQPQINPNQQVGEYVEPQQWNALLEDPNVIVIDTRNDYEISLGSFRGAINPHTRSFREFPSYVAENLNPEQQPKIAMFCTGGIRCEKASAYLLSQGFAQVYHLQGGILRYLEEIEPEASLWEGECFVFDQRVALQHGLEAGEARMCFNCGHPLPPQQVRCQVCQTVHDVEHSN